VGVVTTTNLFYGLNTPKALLARKSRRRVFRHHTVVHWVGGITRLLKACYEPKPVKRCVRYYD
jgi:hypothetical protein